MDVALFLVPADLASILLPHGHEVGYARCWWCNKPPSDETVEKAFYFGITGGGADPCRVRHAGCSIPKSLAKRAVTLLL